MVTRFLSTVGSVKSFFAFRLLAESDFGATHGPRVPDKEGIKLRFLISPQTNIFVYDFCAITTGALTKKLSSRYMSRENVYLNFEFQFSVLRLYLSICARMWLELVFAIMTSAHKGNIAIVKFFREVQPETKGKQQTGLLKRNASVN